MMNQKKPKKKFFKQKTLDVKQSSTIYDRNLLQENLPDWLKELSTTHVILFSTFTFKIPRCNLSYIDLRYHIEFSRHLKVFLDRSLLSNRKQYRNRSAVLFFPEKSKANTPEHLHGFILIHKSKFEKFLRLCVQQESREFIPKMPDKQRDCYVLKDYLLDARINKVPKTFKSKLTSERQKQLIEHIKSMPVKARSMKARELLAQDAKRLHVDTQKIYRIEGAEDFKNTAFYSDKQFLFSEQDYILL